MKVKVYGRYTGLRREYETPGGFQLERYVMNLYPNAFFVIKLVDDDFWVEAYEDNSKKKLIEVHIGKYQEEIS